MSFYTALGSYNWSGLSKLADKWSLPVTSSALLATVFAFPPKTATLQTYIWIWIFKFSLSLSLYIWYNSNHIWKLKTCWLHWLVKITKIRFLLSGPCISMLKLIMAVWYNRPSGWSLKPCCSNGKIKIASRGRNRVSPYFPNQIGYVFSHSILWLHPY